MVAPFSTGQQRSTCRCSLKGLVNKLLLLAFCLSRLAFTNRVDAFAIEGFSLWDTQTDEILRSLESGDIINHAVDGTKLTIVLDIEVFAQKSVGFVQFALDDDLDYRTEATAPYALAGDRNGNYRADPMLMQTGTYTLVAIVYDDTNEVLDSQSITFSIIDDSAAGTPSPVLQQILHPKPKPQPTQQPKPQPTQQPKPQPAPLKQPEKPWSWFPAMMNPLSHAIGSLFSKPPPKASDVPAYRHSPKGALTGTLQQWHKITLGFDGPLTDETQDPFSKYQLDVTFQHTVDGDVTISMVVPGYYAADGNAANTGATGGPVWLVHFSPPATGIWTWECSFVEHRQETLVSAGYFDQKQGSFTVQPSDKTGRDHRRKGRLEYVDGYHHLRFAGTGEFFLKAGSDSPENFLAYEDFDNTPNFGQRRKDWSPHIRDFRKGDPTWSDGKGMGIIGALNYLALEKGINAFSFLTKNIGGDDKNVFPYVSYLPGDRMRIGMFVPYKVHTLQLTIHVINLVDVSKTAQWEVVFEHADKLGLFLHFKLQERELDFMLDGGELGPERKLYYRELIARFGHHLALNWNIGEENENTHAQRVAFANFFKSADPYQSPVVIHDSVENKEEIYGGLLGYPSYNGVSMQVRPDKVFEETVDWLNRSKNAGHHWIVSNDEQNPAGIGVLPDSIDPSHDQIRESVLWGNIIAGGSGLEFYFGYRYENSDLTCNDFRSRDKLWTQARFALDFFQENSIPFWTMTNRDDLISSDSAHCLANEEVFVVQLKNGEGTFIDLPMGSFTVSWFDPKTGIASTTELKETNVEGETMWLGNPSGSSSDDLVVLLSYV